MAIDKKIRVGVRQLAFPMRLSVVAAESICSRGSMISPFGDDDRTFRFITNLKVATWI